MVVSAVVAAASIGTSYIQGKRQERAQKKQLAAQEAAARRAEKQAAQQQEQAQQDYNKANQKKVDTAGIMGRSSNDGGGSTLLTGNQGIDPEKLKLGGNTLLGG